MGGLQRLQVNEEIDLWHAKCLINPALTSGGRGADDNNDNEDKSD